jgi:hypothetical protein
MVDAVPVRNRKFVRGKLLAMWLRITEDGVVTTREMHEFHEAVEGTVKFADANAATYMVEQAAGRSTDLRHFGDLVAVRNAAVTNLPDIA